MGDRRPCRRAASGRALFGLLGLLGLLALLASACTGDDDADTPGQAGHVDEMLAVLPPDTGVAQLVDMAAVEERLGVADVGGDLSEEEADDYAAALSDAPWAGHPLASYVASARGLSWGPADVEWTVSVVLAGGSAQVYGLADDVDPATVVGDLESFGYVPEQGDDATTLTLDLEDVDGSSGMLENDDGALLPFAALGQSATVVPEAGLLVTGVAADRVVDTATGGDTAADSAPLADLVPADVETAHLVIGSACVPRPNLADMPSPDEIEAQVAQYAALGTPEASVTAVTVDDGGEVATTSRLAFADDEAAEADAEARAQFFQQGRSIMTGEAYNEMLGVDGVTVEGTVETIDLDPVDGPQVVGQMLAAADAPFAVCPFD